MELRYKIFNVRQLAQISYYPWYFNRIFLTWPDNKIIKLGFFRCLTETGENPLYTPEDFKLKKCKYNTYNIKAYFIRRVARDEDYYPEDFRNFVLSLKKRYGVRKQILHHPLAKFLDTKGRYIQNHFHWKKLPRSFLSSRDYLTERIEKIRENAAMNRYTPRINNFILNSDDETILSSTIFFRSFNTKKNKII
jgi:hypothetical protein